MSTGGLNHQMIEAVTKLLLERGLLEMRSHRSFLTKEAWERGDVQTRYYPAKGLVGYEVGWLTPLVAYLNDREQRNDEAKKNVLILRGEESFTKESAIEIALEDPVIRDMITKTILDPLRERNLPIMRSFRTDS